MVGQRNARISLAISLALLMAIGSAQAGGGRWGGGGGGVSHEARRSSWSGQARQRLRRVRALGRSAWRWSSSVGRRLRIRRSDPLLRGRRRIPAAWPKALEIQGAEPLDPRFTFAALRAGAAGEGLIGKWKVARRLPSRERIERLGYLNRPTDPSYGFRIYQQSKDGATGGTYAVDVKITRQQVMLKHHVRLVFDPSISSRRRRKFEARMLASTRRYLDRKFMLTDRRGVARYDVRVEVALVKQDVALKPSVVEIQVKAGSGRSDAKTLHVKDDPKVLAHELAHRIFNARDEYVSKLAPKRRAAARHFPAAMVAPQSMMQDVWSRGTRLLPTNVLSVARMMQIVTGERLYPSVHPDHHLRLR